MLHLIAKEAKGDQPAAEAVWQFGCDVFGKECKGDKHPTPEAAYAALHQAIKDRTAEQLAFVATTFATVPTPE